MQIKTIYILTFALIFLILPIFAEEPCDPNCPPGTEFSLGVIKTDLDVKEKTIDIFFYAENLTNRTPINNTRLYVNYVVEADETTIDDAVKTCYVITDENGSTTFPIPTDETECSTFVFAYCLNDSNLDEIKTCLGISDIPSMPSICSGLTETPESIEKPKIYAAPGSSRYCIPKRFNLEMSFCMPIMLILGLLSGAMFLSGMNPLNYFDLSGAPRFPRQQPYRLRKSSAFFSIAGAIGSGLNIGSSMKTLFSNKKEHKEYRKKEFKKQAIVLSAGVVATGLSKTGNKTISKLKLDEQKENFVNTVKLVNTMRGAKSESTDGKPEGQQTIDPTEGISTTSLMAGWKEAGSLLKTVGMKGETLKGKLSLSIASFGMAIWINPYISAFIPISLLTQGLSKIKGKSKDHKKLIELWKNGNIDENSIIEIGNIDKTDINNPKIEITITDSNGEKNNLTLYLNELSQFTNQLNAENNTLDNGINKEQKNELINKFGYVVGTIRNNILIENLISRRGENLFPELGKLKVNSLDGIIGELAELDKNIDNIDKQIIEAQKNNNITELRKLNKQRSTLRLSREEIMNRTVERITNPSSTNPIAPSLIHSQNELKDMINKLVELTNEQPENIQIELRTAEAFRQYEKEMLDEETLKKGLAILLTAAFITKSNLILMKGIDMQNTPYIEEYKKQVEETEKEIEKLRKELENKELTNEERKEIEEKIKTLVSTLNTNLENTKEKLEKQLEKATKKYEKLIEKRDTKYAEKLEEMVDLALRISSLEKVILEYNGIDTEIELPDRAPQDISKNIKTNISNQSAAINATANLAFDLTITGTITSEEANSFFINHKEEIMEEKYSYPNTIDEWRDITSNSVDSLKFVSNINQNTKEYEVYTYSLSSLNLSNDTYQYIQEDNDIQAEIKRRVSEIEEYIKVQTGRIENYEEKRNEEMEKYLTENPEINENINRIQEINNILKNEDEYEEVIKLTEERKRLEQEINNSMKEKKISHNLNEFENTFELQMNIDNKIFNEYNNTFSNVLSIESQITEEYLKDRVTYNDAKEAYGYLATLEESSKQTWEEQKELINKSPEITDKDSEMYTNSVKNYYEAEKNYYLRENANQLWIYSNQLLEKNTHRELVENKYISKEEKTFISELISDIKKNIKHVYSNGYDHELSNEELNYQKGMTNEISTYSQYEYLDEERIERVKELKEINEERRKHKTQRFENKIEGDELTASLTEIESEINKLNAEQLNIFPLIYLSNSNNLKNNYANAVREGDEEKIEEYREQVSEQDIKLRNELDEYERVSNLYATLNPREKLILPLPSQIELVTKNDKKAKSLSREYRKEWENITNNAAKDGIKKTKERIEKLEKLYKKYSGLGV